MRLTCGIIDSDRYVAVRDIIAMHDGVIEDINVSIFLHKVQ